LSKFTVISFPTCPFVQRAIIALKEKQADFEVIYIDLSNKPDWFLEISPLGKVPVLKVERPGKPPAAVFESAVIVEYLEDQGGTPLHPADPLERAQHRAWVEFGSQLLMDLWKIQMATAEDDLAAGKTALAAKLKRLEGELGEGPYFAGKAFSVVDATFAPAFRQIGVLDAHGAKLLDGFPKVAAWAEALAERPSVRDAVPSDYESMFLDPLRARGSLVVSGS
jgi:glutathione S-transferase